ncbi:PAS domain S-box protein [Burkholderia stagnalis]|uniref:PAS domain S-box protein n=1 Tax=Burkholderia stagnalis TaxID=1503054 RepID=UPI00289327EA|nr:PAS domain S-box protein [Burkholderia stagnalis]
MARVSAEDRYRSLVDAIRDYAIFLLDPTGHVASWNVGAERIKGYRASEIIGQHFSVFYPSEAVERGYPGEELARAVTLGRWEDEGWRIRKDGSRFWANVVITALRDQEGTLIGFAKVTRDLTERRSNEEKLRQSEERLRLLMDAVDDAVFMLDPQGYITSWNAGAKRLKGFESSEIIGQHVSRFYPMEDIAARKPDRELAIAAKDGRVEEEGWRLRKDGSRFWSNVVITAVYGPAGELLGFAKVTRDMTERNRLKQLEYASELASRIEAAREEEKKRIARELHDDLGQQLTALKMALSSLSIQNNLTLESGETAENMRAAIDRAIISVRRLAAGLRPTILDDLGLLPALEWLIDDFRQRSGLQVLLHVEIRNATFNDAASTALFRIVQEGLTNIARHAHNPTEVRITFCCSESLCDLSIEDDGQPIASTDRVTGAAYSSGLAGIRDRVRRLGGTSVTEPLPQRGFSIRLSIPRASITDRPNPTPDSH